MKIDAYLKVNNLSVREFAKQAGISPMIIYHLLHERDILISTAHTIFVASKGKVSWIDMLPQKKRMKLQNKPNTLEDQPREDQ